MGEWLALWRNSDAPVATAASEADRLFARAVTFIVGRVGGLDAVSVVWVLVAIGLAETAIRCLQIVWPAVRSQRYRGTFQGAVFVLAGALSIAGGVDLFQATPRVWPEGVRIFATGVVAALVSLQIHALISSRLRGFAAWLDPRSAWPPGGGKPVATTEVSAPDPSISRALRPADSRTSKREQEILALQLALRLRGFLNRNHEPGVYDAETERAIAAYQHFHGLVVDGYAGLITQAHLMKPACGRADKPKSAGAVGGAASARCSWPNKPVRWRLDGPLKDVSQSEFDRIADKAFKRWEGICRVSFQKVGPSAETDIRIEWRHAVSVADLGSAADGTIAYSYASCSSTLPGHIILEHEQNWEVTTPDEQSKFYKTLLHEIGHAIGIDGHIDWPASERSVMRQYPLESDGTFSAEDTALATKLY
jgi:hypothetical protein